MKQALNAVACMCLLASCAGSYRTLTPATLNYANNAQSNQKIEVSYLYDIQGMSRNKRYSKKERKFGYAAVGLRIKNISDEAININASNFKILANGMEKQPIEPEIYAKVVKQTSATYLLHALWGPWSYTTVEYGPSGGRETEFKYIPVGAAVGVVNLIIAESANTNHLKTLKQHIIYGKSIQPGESLYGIAIIPITSYEPLTFSFVD